MKIPLAQACFACDKLFGGVPPPEKIPSVNFQQTPIKHTYLNKLSLFTIWWFNKNFTQTCIFFELLRYV